MASLRFQRKIWLIMLNPTEGSTSAKTVASSTRALAWLADALLRYVLRSKKARVRTANGDHLPVIVIEFR